MFSLFIDTHDSKLKLILYKDKNLQDSIINEAKMNHSDVIMSLLEELLNRNNIKINDINEMLVVNGPGSFTGVRIGVTIAKMIAYTLNIPIKTITSLEMLSINSDKDNKLAIIRDFKGVYGAVYDKDNNLIEDYFYLSNSEFNESKYVTGYNIIEDIEFDYNKLIKYMESKETINPHAVNPIYIKVIEALK